MSRRRVVITGAGCVTAIGNTIAQFSDALFAGRSGITPLALKIGEAVNFSYAAQVHDFVPEDWVSPALLPLTERSSQFAIAAAKQAVADSQMLTTYSPDAMAVVMGCSVGGIGAQECELHTLFTQQGRIHPFSIPRVMASSGASQISILFGITGPVLNFSTACTSSTHAIGHAFHLIRSGVVDAALAGGHEAPFTYGFLKAWESMRVISPTRCKPFSRERDGMTLGEGSALLVLEERELALKRGVKIYAEVCGFGMSSDAVHITKGQSSGPASAMRRALQDAQVASEQVNYINAHGTGTNANDRIEAEAIREVFGEHSGKIPVSSTKALHGHAIGATGAIEALATVLALKKGCLPMSYGAEPQDLTFGLNLIHSPMQFTPIAAISNSFAFGGLNASLVFRPHSNEGD